MIIVMVGSFVTCYGPDAAAAMYFATSTELNKDYRLVTIPAFFNACVMETVFGKAMDESSEVSSKTEVSSVSTAS
ncbi:hypothetical protein VZT92_016672 [Zoarces viviparus]|uniref:Uncharacterized protein n=1 Tax=Zoarces viviparus TaxID=48416 RepID=A0AAW1EV06_ZOAVI